MELESEAEISPENMKKIWAVGGGKGGVGKSLVSANVAICLALMGNKVVAVDLDLGGANLHTCLGLPIPQTTLSDYVSKKVDNFEDLLVTTPINNLKIISGAQDELGMANLKHMHKNQIIKKLSELDADYILFDLGAGTAFNTIDFFISADKGILVVLPEPTSIENTYRFIKSVFYRRLKMVDGIAEIEPLINEAMNAKLSLGGTTSPADLIRKITEINPEVGRRVKEEMADFRPNLIINQVRSQADIDIGYSIQSICRKYFGIEMTFPGYLDYDQSVWQSVRKRKPLLIEYPNSKLVNNFDRIVNRLIES
ncbi:P-loop NTPase [Peredibacter starrii]|uniref:P-loop NTPase n=1 Tax=Peredibacter starrii TaxID=28202 RepID=A0AAX4HNH3_9BACT|nr:P-loop NTPase [Peredibacter starrii]WPU64873.1 P-loop NTPase [Peredibacter starrii]